MRISNITLYERTESVLVSIRAVKMRWNLMGKILRGDESEPALRAMKEYYQGKQTREKYKGTKTSIATIIQNESKYAKSSKPHA